MSRRSFLVAAGVFAFVVLGLGTIVWLLLRYEPRHYAPVDVPSAHRDALAREFVKEFSDFWSSLQNGVEWSGQFKDEQINCYLSEALHRQGLADRFLPEGVEGPRIAFLPERIRVAFRYRSRFVNTVISVTLRVWVPHSEPNVLAVQLECFRAGLIPISAHWLLEQLSEAARVNGVEVSWYRHEGYPVALLRFQGDRARPTMQIKAVQIEAGSISVHGRSIDPRAAAAPPRPSVAKN